MRGRNDRRRARLGSRSRRLIGHELLTLRKQRASRKQIIKYLGLSLKTHFLQWGFTIKCSVILLKSNISKHQEEHFTCTTGPLKIWLYTGSVLKGEMTYKGQQSLLILVKMPCFFTSYILWERTPTRKTLTFKFSLACGLSPIWGRC